MSEQEKAYDGSKRCLVLSLDVGTTYSGMSYCIMNPGDVPKINSVTRYPGQEHAAGSSKIPTVLLYDSNGKVRAAGAETLLAENVEQAEDEGWIKVDWFKLRITPSSMPNKLKTSEFPPLPPSKSIVHVFGDMMAYLLACAERFIQETHPTLNSPGVWAELRRNATFVIAHPNSWDGRQQSKLMQAATHGGLIDGSSKACERIIFVSEGEASLHHCLRTGMIPKLQSGFIVADLGGGTLDFSAYKITKVNPLVVEEIAVSRCELEGSILVTQRAKLFLQKKLSGSIYGTPENITQIAERFDETTKRTFRSVDDKCMVQFGSPRDTDAAHDIRSGRLKLAGADVVPFFEPAVEACINAIAAQLEETFVDIQTVYAVGGFSTSPYLISQLTERLQPFGITISTPDGQTSKTVADGCISYFLNGHVSSRVARATYLLEYDQTFQPDDPDHKRRANSFRRLPNGAYGAKKYAVLLRKGTSVSAEMEYRQILFDTQEIRESFVEETMTILAFTGIGTPPSWPDEPIQQGSLKRLCNLYVNRDLIHRVAKPVTCTDGSVVWRYDVEVSLSFGGPQLKAFYWYEEAGIMKRSEVQIIYNDVTDHGRDATDVGDNFVQAVARFSM